MSVAQLGVLSSECGYSYRILAATLASSLGLERKWFKDHMRKLKELGLTESLEIGYRISPEARQC
ncbi:MAG TPA: hypothetical protein VHH35_20430 [Pyrinomonadaceae bacterium]|nr:hypothetical protein [Pyrinomonadaceae bacterium]